VAPHPPRGWGATVILGHHHTERERAMRTVKITRKSLIGPFVALGLASALTLSVASASDSAAPSQTIQLASQRIGRPDHLICHSVLRRERVERRAWVKTRHGYKLEWVPKWVWVREQICVKPHPKPTPTPTPTHTSTPAPTTSTPTPTTSTPTPTVTSTPTTSSPTPTKTVTPTSTPTPTSTSASPTPTSTPTSTSASPTGSSPNASV
jgi:hypothetical protein